MLNAFSVCAAPSRTTPPVLPAFEVPGGTARFAEMVGIRPTIPRSRILLTAIRVLWEVPSGADPAADRRRAVALDYLRQLAASAKARQPGSDTSAADSRADMAPSYLPPQTWAAVLQDRGEFSGSWFTAIVGNRQAALLYHGLAALDPPTLSYFAAHPDVLKEILDKRAAMFSTFGRSIRVRDGRVEVPGGANAVPLWEAVAGAPVAEPGTFVMEVLSKDGGRLALLYDGLSHLEPGALRFALGLSLPADERVDRFRGFYDAAGAALGQWKPADRPFERVPFDAVHLLLASRFDRAGQPQGPAWRAFWEAVFDAPTSLPRDAIDKVANRIKTDQRLDAEQLVRLVSVGDAVARRQRCEAWLFASRVFGDATRESVRDLLPVLKAFGRFQSLLPTLERMGVTAPATYSAAVAAAVRLSDADYRLWQFQAALSVLERVRFSRAIDAASADALVRSLCGLESEDEGGTGGRGVVARWIEQHLFAAVPASVLPAGVTAADRPLETRLLAAMAGAVSSPENKALQALPPVEWEGLKYRFDPAGSLVRQLIAVRARQGGRSLDAVLALARAGGSLASAPSAGAAQAATRDLGRTVAALTAPSGDPRPSRLPGREPNLDDLLKETVERARKLKAAPEPKALAQLARPLLDASDWYLAEVLGSIAYAPHLGAPDGPALLGGDPSRVHDFRFFSTAEATGRSAWQWPIEARAPDIGWHVTGSLLGLDLALGRLSLRRIPRETIPEAPRLSEAMREAFIEDALLIDPFDLSETAGQAVCEAVKRGRQRVTALAGTSEAVEAAAADAGLDEWRAEALRWTAVLEPDRRLDLFSLAELARLGGLGAEALAGLDAWGTSAWSRDGPLATSYPQRLPWSTLAGRRVVRAVPALVPDLTIGIVEALTPLRLHAAIAAGVLAFATQDYIDTLRTAHEDDWQEMVAHAQALASGPIEDYVAGLTITGPLVPDETESKHDGHQQQAVGRR